MNHLSSNLHDSSVSSTDETTQRDTVHVSTSCSTQVDSKVLIFPRISLAGLTENIDDKMSPRITDAKMHVSQVSPSQCNQHTKCNNRYDNCHFHPTEARSTSWSVVQNSPDTATVRYLVEAKSNLATAKNVAPNTVDQLILTNIDDSGETMTSL